MMGGLKDGLGGGTGVEGAKNEFNEDLLITGTAKILFRDAGIYLQSSEDGKFVISADGTSDATITLNGNVSVTLGDKEGANQLTIKDSDGFPVAKLDSQGNLKYKGKTQRV